MSWTSAPLRSGNVLPLRRASVSRLQQLFLNKGSLATCSSPWLLPKRSSQQRQMCQPRDSEGQTYISLPTDESDSERAQLDSRSTNLLDTPDAESTALAGPKVRLAVLLGGAAAVAVLLLVLAQREGVSLGNVGDRVEAAVRAAGPAGPAVFIAAYVLAAVALVPASVLTLAAGYLFGPAEGTAVVSVAATLGASAAFLVSRYAARPFVASKLKDYPKFAQVDKSISQKGAQVVLLLRLSPLVPFGLLNYMLGLTSVPFWPFVGASWAGMLPGTFAYVYLGNVAKEAAGGEGGFSGVKFALYAVGAVATLGATKLISDQASRALNDNAAEGTDEPGDRAD